MKKNVKANLLILLGSVLWSLTMFKSGLKYSFGYGFWGPNGHDGIWHIALANSLANGNLNNPVFAGELLKNYHLGFDTLLALLHKLTFIKISTLYFQILPFIFALLIGFLTYQFVYSWRKSKEEAFWSTFFVYFSTSFGFLVSFLKDGIFSGESTFWSQQSFSTLVNPPYALSLIFILSGLILLQKKKYFWSILFFGILIQIKAYAAILSLGALGVVSLFEIYKNKNFRILKVFLGSLILNLILFFSFNNDSVSVFEWQPFWFLETMMSYGDRLGWNRFYQAMTTYRMGGVWIKAFLAYSLAFVIFLIGNLGIRIIGFDYLIKIFKRKKFDATLIFVVSMMFGAVAIPMFFVQRGTPWNTIQFFYYFLFLFSIFAGISFSKIDSKKLKTILSAVFIILGSWVTLQHYLPSTPPAKISNEEIEALKFLNDQQHGTVLSYPYDANKAKANVNKAPRPLYFYESTAYVSATSGKAGFLEDEVNANIMGYDWKKRREDVLDFISNLDPEKGRQFLKENNIKYLYLVKENSPLFGEELKLGADDLGLEKIFENSVVVVYNTLR